ncbi:hypothetical protein [Aquimarina sp. MMG016]|uniref:hypothetical protein n=1 Tax=Aquimarina sp. MMG016 TaxID=2822690 RepID=UPI001B3A2FAF|nr:hypothetical protein [Aquimarina sp. MMG016]MBQ4820193.1 hypothetical protein [Aquimarina sp. MMG016]
MKKNKLSELTNEELLFEKKKLKKRKIVNATLIGFLAGIFFIGIAALVSKPNALGIIPMLIPIFLIYKLVNNSKKDKNLEELLKERNLN